MTPWFAFDLDDTLGEFNESAYQAFNKHRGTDYKVADTVDYGLLDKFDYTVDEFWHLLYELRVCADMQPIPGVADALSALHSRGGKIHIITARKQMRNHFDVTQEWLRRHGIPYDALTIVHRALHTKGDFLCKDTIAFFEDSPDQLRGASKITHPVLVDRPWNRKNRESHWLCTTPSNLVQMIERVARHVD